MRSLQLGSIYHQPWLEYRHTLPDGRVCLRLRTAKGDFSHVYVKVTSNYNYPSFFADATHHPMQIAYQDELFSFYEVIITPQDLRMRYLFVLQSDSFVFKLDAMGLHAGEDYPEDASQSFAFAYAYPAKAMPEWAIGCTGYQIFPDRFRRKGEAEEGIEPWSSDRVQNEFRYGGNLQGIIEAVPYLKNLGITLIYMTPIFVSDTSHRYNTFDYYQIDPLLGTEADLKELCQLLHQNDMRLILDGVFNHCGLQFAPFVDALTNKENSPYYHWFFFDDTEACGYQTFGHWPYMPKLNLENEACANYFLGVGQYWLTQCGIDGWRMDVSPEVYPAFWRQFKTMMRKVNPDSLFIAECWDDSREWLTQGDMFDSTMNYVLCQSLWACFGSHTLNAIDFDYAVNRMLALYPQRVQEVLWNFLGSHDTKRMRTRAGDDLRMLHIASFFQYTFLGIPIIYYGDELGMQGGDDPYCRFPMPWNNVQNNATHAHYQNLCHIRNNTPALRHGTFRTYCALESGLYAYLRSYEEQTVLCVLNIGLSPIHHYLPLPKTMAGMAVIHDLYEDKPLPITESGCVLISLTVGQGVILCQEDNVK